MDLLLSQFHCNDKCVGASHPKKKRKENNKSTYLSLHYFCSFSCKRLDVGLINLKHVSETYAIGKKKTTITETIRLHRLCWFGCVQRVEENRIPKRVLYMSLETKRLRGRPRNRWQDEVREDGRIVGGEGWQEKVYNRRNGRRS